MNRVEIKNKAKEIMKGRVWELFQPMFIIFVIIFGVSLVFTILFPSSINNEEISAPANLLMSVLLAPLELGYILFILNVVRKKKYELNNIFTPYNQFLVIIIVQILVTLAALMGFILLIVPMFIVLLMFAMVYYVILDGETDAISVLSKSRELMKGYKWDYFVFNLSYLGWVLLVPFTLGLILIWLIPYYTIGQTIYYDNLVKKSKKAK